MNGFNSILFLILAALLAGHAVAEGFVAVEGEGIEPTIGPTPTPEPTPIPPDGYRINQGDTVYIGDCPDVSGVIPPYDYIAYWDGYDMYQTDPSYKIETPAGKQPYYHYCIDQETFGERYGRWYKYAGYYEPQGNNLAFVVKPATLKNSTLTFPNGTSINQSEIVNATREEKTFVSPLLSERYMGDYVVARGQAVNVNLLLNQTEHPYHLWVFGSGGGLYDMKESVISASKINSLKPGDYTMLIHQPGNNSIYEARYEKEMIYPALYGKEPLNVLGFQPLMIYGSLTSMLAGSDDIVLRKKLVVEDVYITINMADEMTVFDKTVMDVRGYTNAANGTKITVALDERDRKEWVAETTAVQTSPGNLSYYKAYIPIVWDELAADARNHTLVARTDIGGEVSKDFKISVMPADSYKPNATLKYIEDRNPFIPTPTPERIEVPVTVTIVKTVTIPVTPSNEQVYAQQKAAEDAKWQENMSLATTGVLILLFLLFCIGLMYYGITIYRRL